MTHKGKPGMKIGPLICVACIAFLTTGCSSSLPVLQWEPTGGPFAQNIVSLTVDEGNPQVLYAGTADGEVFSSSDKGHMWVRLAVLNENSPVYQVIQHSDLKMQMYAATDHGLYLSTNGGKGWTNVPIGNDASSPCHALHIDPFKSNLLYAGLQGKGIYKSSDAGATWSRCDLGIEPQRLARATVNGLATEVLHPDVLYAALSGVGLLKSTNAGDSWTLLTEGVIYVGASVTSIVVNRREQGSICFGTDDGSIYRSSNGGRSWTLSRRGQTNDGVLSFAAHPWNPETVFAGTGSGVLISPDFGASWRSVSPELPRSAASIVVSPESPEPGLYLYGQGVGVRYSPDNGRTWLRADSHLGGATVTSIVTDKTGVKVYSAVGSAIYQYIQASGSWEFSGNGLIGRTISSVAFDSDSTSTLYAGTSNGLYRTTNGGRLWDPFSQTMLFNQIQFVDTHPSIPTRMYAATERALEVSTDRGVTWTRTGPTDKSYHFRSLTFSPRNAGNIYGATSNEGVIMSGDGGITWKEVGYWQTDRAISAMTIDARSQGTLYAWTMGGDGFRSTDNGTLWHRYVPPWEVGDSVYVAPDRYAPSSAVALVNSRRLFVTHGGGATWIEIPVAPLPKGVRSLCWNRMTSTVYAGTGGSGVYRISLQQSLAEETEK